MPGEPTRRKIGYLVAPMKRSGIAVMLAVTAIAILVAIRSRSPTDGIGPAKSGLETVGSQRRLETGSADLAESAGTGRERVAPPASAAAESERSADGFRGRVLDARTGEPVGRLRIQAGGTAIHVDEWGAFAVVLPLADDVRVLQVLDDFRNGLVATLERKEIESLAGESILRVPIGPTYRLRIVGLEPESTDELVARLVERRADGRELAGIWLPIPGLPQTYLRLDQPWPENGEGSQYQVQVHTVDGDLSGTSALLDRAIGVYPGVVEVELARSAGILHGRVVDREGRPQPRARVVALPFSSSMPSNSPSAWPEASADAEGKFRFRPLAPGVFEILARPAVAGVSARLRVDLQPGERDLGDLIVEPIVAVGSIRGYLEIPTGGRFSRSDRVRLHAVDGRTPDRFTEVDYPPVPRSRRSDPPTSAPFAFDGLPAGEYELTIVSPFGFSWSPARALVTAPATDVVFAREDVPRENLCVDVEDAASHAPIEGFSYSVRVSGSPLPAADEGVGGTFCVSVPVHAEVEWRVWAEGYRTARLPRERFTASPEGLGATVSLVPGFDATIRVLDFGDGVEPGDSIGRFAAIFHPGVDGAEIRGDGVVLARTGPDGRAEIDADREPARIEVTAKGWRAAACWNMAEGRILAARQDVVVWMVRD
jgi:hypothetical protein